VRRHFSSFCCHFDVFKSFLRKFQNCIDLGHGNLVISAPSGRSFGCVVVFVVGSCALVELVWAGASLCDAIRWDSERCCSGLEVEGCQGIGTLSLPCRSVSSYIVATNAACAARKGFEFRHAGRTCMRVEANRVASCHVDGTNSLRNCFASVCSLSGAFAPCASFGKGCFVLRVEVSVL
jgi:hypothetical protein